MEHFFIVYDFSSDSRRAKFVKTLEKYGIRIQFSIFEFSLTKARKIEMLAHLKTMKQEEMQKLTKEKQQTWELAIILVQ